MIFVTLNPASAGFLFVRTLKVVEYKQEEPWHIRKEISITTIVAILGIMLSGVYAVFNIQQSLVSLNDRMNHLEGELIPESRIIRLEERQARIERDLKSIREDVQGIASIEAMVREIRREIMMDGHLERKK